MTTTRNALIFVLLFIVASAATAQIDPNSNGIGIYADTGGLTNEVKLGSGSAMEVYLLLTRPTGTGTFAGWECQVIVPDNVTIWGWNLVDYENTAVIGTAPAFATVFTPVPYQTVMHLLTFIVVPLDCKPAQFFITGFPFQTGPGIPNYLNRAEDGGGNIITMTPYPGLDNQPCFTVNPASVSATSTTWGGVKALYQ